MKPNRAFPLALALCTLSGAAALSHELLWTRRLVDLLGGTSEATARVLGCFFLGLAIGGAVVGRLVPRIKHPWRAVALAELAIGLSAVPALTLPYWTDWVWPALGPAQLVAWQGWFVKTALSGLVVLPPSFFMGTTLPLFAAAALYGSATLARQGVWLYAANTLGGVIGLVVTGGWLLERFGVMGTMAAAILANLVVASCSIAVSRLAWAQSEPNEASGQITADMPPAKLRHRLLPAPPGLRTALSLAAFSGFAVLGLEVLAIRMLSLIVPSSFQATTAVLIAVILTLAVAAAITPLFARWSPSPRYSLVVVLAACAIITSLCPAILVNRTDQLVDVPHLAATAGRHLATTPQFTAAVCGVAFVSVGPALLAGGMVLPLVFAWMGNRNDDPRGRKLGFVLAVNGLGGLAGTEVVARFVLPAIGIYQGFAVIGFLYAVASAVVLGIDQRRWMIALPITAALAVASLAAGTVPRLPYLNPRTAARFRILSTDFGRDGVLHVTRTSTGRKGMLLNNQYMLGGTAAMDAQRRQVLLPLILHPHPERVCCIGLATGISAGGALDHAPPCEVTAIEISAMVTASAARDFAEENRQVCQSRHADVIVEDARTYVASARDQFDVIVGDLFRPYGAGEGRLYSREHFAAVRAALRDGGLFCQWLPMYQLTADQFAIIARTFLSVFPEAELLRGNRESRPLLGLVGCRSGTIEFSHVDARCALLRQQQRISDKVLLSRSGIESLYLGRVDAGALPDAQINTLNNAVVELLAGRIRVTRDPRVAEVNRTPQSAYLTGQQWVAFERELQRYLMTAH